MVEYTKEDSPWLKAQKDNKLLEDTLKNCTWCEGSLQETRTDYWECITCGKYHEMS